jgi:hypothetical protein
MRQPFGAQLVAGDTWTWSIADLDYDPSVYTLKYFFRGPGKLDLTSTADDTAFSVEATALQTGALPAGDYVWQAAIYDAGGDRVAELARGSVEILENIEKRAEGTDGRTWVKRTLDAIRACLGKTASREENEYQVNGRMLKFRSSRELLDLEREFARRYDQELEASGQKQGTDRQVFVRFGGGR